MSHIFDALQISEAVRTGSKQRGLLSVTELLERAEFEETANSSGETTEEVCMQSSAPNEGLSTGKATCLSATSLPYDLSLQLESRACTDLVEHFGHVEIVPSSCPQLAAFNDKHSPAAEAFRLLGVRLHQLREQHNLQKVLVTSTVPQEGKTFTAGNLACALPARSQERVLLVDGDLRRTSLSQMFELGAASGLCECLHSEKGLASTIFRLKGTDIWVLPAGKVSANPLELIQSAKLPALIDKLSAWFDWIVVDSPPVLPLADTSAWSGLADGILLVTRPGFTERRKLQAGVEAIDAKKLIGVILNDSRNPSAADYGYYGHLSAKTESY